MLVQGYSHRQSNVILNKALSLSLNVCALAPTPGDGNCFYHAILQTLSVIDRPYSGSHLQLRNEVVSFVDNNRHLGFVQNWVNTIVDEDLSDVINRQYQCGTFANELFIRATAVRLNVAILFTKENSTNQYPYDYFLPTINVQDIDMSSFMGTFIIIGHAQHHFQSLRFKNDIPPWDDRYVPFIPEPTIDFRINFPDFDKDAQARKYKRLISDKSNADQKKIRLGAYSTLGNFDLNSNEKDLQEECIRCGIKYIHPMVGETSEQCILRLKQLRAILKKTEDCIKQSEVEQELQQGCCKYGFKYVPPTPGETTEKCKIRRKKLRALFNRVKQSELLEKQIEQDCNSFGVKYIPPSSTDTFDMCKKRQKQLRALVSKQQKDLKRLKSVEMLLEQECINFAVKYIPPPSGETTIMCRKRRKQLRTLLKEKNVTVHPESSSPLVESGPNVFLNENPRVHKMIRKFDKGELKHTIKTCKSCYESRPVFHKTDASSSFSGDHKPHNIQSWDILNNNRCVNCHDEFKKNKKKQSALKFSGYLSTPEDCYTEGDSFFNNNQHFFPIPPFLKDLTFVESLLIRKISIAVYVHSLKYGMLASKGHAVAIPHDLKVFTKLPQLPSEVGILLLRSGKSKSKAYMASRERVQKALEGLVFGFPKFGVLEAEEGYSIYTGRDHCSGIVLIGKYFLYPPNPYYYDVVIEENRLNKLPENLSEVDGLPVYSTQEKCDDDEDLGPGPEQFDKLELEEEVTSCSGFAAQLTNQDADENVKKALQRFLGDNSDKWEEMIRNGQVADVGNIVTPTQEKPIHELSTDGFFTMAYPHIFINGSCDITIKAMVNIDYDSWVEHIYHCNDNRVAAHRFFKFHLLNIGMRKKALNQGSFCVNQQLNEKHLTRDELKEKLLNNDESIPRKFISMSANLPNTDPYWRERKHELDALCFFMLKEYDVFPTYFDTSSCAEHHWVPLHNLLIKYLAKVNKKNEEEIKEKFETDSNFKHQVLLQNQHIVTSYFHARHTNYKNTVLKDLLQYQDDWSRYEFAKSRGAIHSHSLYFSKQHYDNIKSIMTQDSSDPNVDIAKDLEKWLQSNENNENGTFSPMFVSMHPAGGEFKTNPETKIEEWVSKKDDWPLPEGTLKHIDNDVLKGSLTSLCTLHDMKDFQKNVVNKIMLHQCSLYCLRRKTVKTDEKDESGELKNKIVRYCRHHFGDFDSKSKKSSGKEVDPVKARVIDGRIQRYEGRNDHPRMVQHVGIRPLSWLAQCDTQPIISQDLVALLKYISGYCCKGAATTDDFINIYSQILDKSESNVSMKSVAQKLLLKAAGIVDTPSSAADYINTKGKLVQCSRRFRRIGLSGYRMFDPNGDKEGNVTKKTPLDQFLSVERRKSNPTICLYDWAKKCNCAKSKSCGRDHVPLFTGCLNYWIWPVTEDFAKSLLMMFSPGTWENVDDLKNEGESFTQSFSIFLDSEVCPVAVQMMLKFAKITYDRKTSRNSSGKKQFDASANFSQSTEGSQDSQEEFTFGNELLRDIAIQQKSGLDEAQVDEEVLYNGGEEFNWHYHGLQSLGVPKENLDFDEMKTWLPKISEQASAAFKREGNECTLPVVNPRLVNKLQMIIVNYNLKHLLQFAQGKIEVGFENCQRLIVQGCAGTGKSQVIKILTRLVRRIFKCNKSVLNVAPTGAAAVLLPDGGTIHSSVHIPRKGRKSDTATLLDRPMSVKKMKALKSIALTDNETLALHCVNADERGMIGQYILAWFHQRFLELSFSLIENGGATSFGCLPAFNFFGDIFQLGAICERNLYDEVLQSTNAINLSGNLVYNSFVDVIVLDEIMRQKSDQQQLLQRLDRIRTGNVKRDDWEAINKRAYASLSAEERQSFDDNASNTICLCETWEEATKYNKRVLNSKYVSGSRVASAEIISTGSGRHHMCAKESMGQIPNMCVVATGCRVILTRNQGELTRLGLNNGAIGTVVSILYDENKRPPAFPEAVIIDFPKYRGPSWNDHHPTWVPITLNSVMCDDKCCSRNGFPLIPGYAITIAKSQGMTIGKKQQITKAIIKLSDKINMEKVCYGTAYTAFSRVTEDTDWCLAEAIPFERLEYLNRHPKKKVREAEEKRLLQLSELTIQNNECSVKEYLDLLAAIDEFCVDGISDAVCDSLGDCTCVFHSKT